MNLDSSVSWYLRKGIPRVSGGEPYSKIQIASEYSYSPRERG